MRRVSSTSTSRTRDCSSPRPTRSVEGPKNTRRQGSVDRVSLPYTCSPSAQEERSSMPNRGTIRGTHHLTFCVGGAQEDYDFHVRLLGLKSVKKTVLFDGEIPIYHLYYGNKVGDASTLLTSFPYRQAGWMGKRGTNQLKTLMLSVPADSIGFWVDRLNEKGVDNEVVTRF